MAGGGRVGGRRGGAGRGGRGGRGGRQIRGGARSCPPPPPPHPTDIVADINETAAALANIDDSPSRRTRQQLILAMNSGSNAASAALASRRRALADAIIDSPGRRTRQRREQALADATSRGTSHSGTGHNTVSTAVARRTLVEDVIDDPPSGRMRQERERVDSATSNAAGTSSTAYMRRLFADADATSDEDYNSDEEEPTELTVPVAASRQLTVVQEQVQYGSKRLTNAGRDWLLEKCVKEDVFPKIKFASLTGDLDFSNNPNSICRFMAEKMKVREEDIESWWESSKKAVHKKLTTNRNNAIKAMKTRFLDNILAVTNRRFRLESIVGMRKIASRPAYIELLDCLVRAVVGRRVYVDNRMTNSLSEWFTLTDEAFLLLCLDSYVPKWNSEWAQAALAPAAPATLEQQEDGEQKQGDEQQEARYTGKSRGTKRSWSPEGMQRFNALMVDVYRDRQANGANFDIVFKEKMIKRYSKQIDDTNLDEHEPGAPENRVQLVYSDFNMEQFMAHATTATTTAAAAAGVASRQERGYDDEDDDDDVSRIMV